MLNTPTAQEIADAAGVTNAYARMLLGNDRRPSLTLALTLYDKLGCQLGPLEGLSKREIETARKMAA